MHSIGLPRLLCGVLILAALCAYALADAGRAAPRFTVRTLDGETFTNESLSGRVVLLQFWVTWCPYCRRDQAAVDSLDRTLSSRGLIVLAVNLGQSEDTVRAYLRQNPRSCRILVNQGEALAGQFGASGYPYYVVIDRNGIIAGTQSGSAGEGALRQLLSRAGLWSSSGARTAQRQRPSTPAARTRSTVIELPPVRSVAPRKPGANAVFVLTTGERLEPEHYTLDSRFLTTVVGGRQRIIPLTALDAKATILANHERGIEIRIPARENEAFVTF